MKKTKAVGAITCYISRPGTQFGGHAFDQRIARIPVSKKITTTKLTTTHCATSSNDVLEG